MGDTPQRRPLPPPLPPPAHPSTHDAPPPPAGWPAAPLRPADPGPPRWPPVQPSYTSRSYADYRAPSGPPGSGWSVSGPGHGGYGGYGPPPRRSSGTGRAVTGMIGVIALIVFVLVIAAAFVRDDTGPSFVRDAGSGQPAAPSNPDAQPVDPDRFRAVLRSNTLYQQGGLDNSGCEAADLGDGDLEEQRAYYTRMMGCLDTEWGPLVISAGYGYRTPSLVVFDSPVSTPCGNAAPGDGRTLAFYCPADAVLYADAPQMQRFFGTAEMAYAVVIGHEFGHHVQQETGILVAYDDAVHARFSERFELSRRLELQASCMSGLFLGAVAATYPITESDFVELRQISLSFGDEPDAPEEERDHGSGLSNQRWILAAFRDNDTAQCNTFTAPAAQVD